MDGMQQDGLCIGVTIKTLPMQSSPMDGITLAYGSGHFLHWDAGEPEGITWTSDWAAITMADKNGRKIQYSELLVDGSYSDLRDNAAKKWDFVKKGGQS